MSSYDDKIWLKQYPEDVPREIDENAHPHLCAFYDESNQTFANRIAFKNLGVSLTYKASQAHAQSITAWLQQHFKEQDRIAIMSPNCLQYPILIQAIHQAGMIVVNINPLLTPRELEHILEDSGASALFVWDGAAHTIDELENIHALQHVIPLSIADVFPTFKRVVVQFVLKYVKRLIKPYHLTKVEHTPLSTLLAQDGSGKVKKTNINAEDIAFLQYTGGTTGRSKGVILTHKNLVANVQQATSYLPKELRTDETKNVITALPLYHIFSLTANFYVMFGLGKENILITNPRDLPTFIKTLIENPPHAITGVNTLFHALANHPDIQKVDFSHLKLSLGGGMAVQKFTAQLWKQITGCFILEAYGLTETSPAATINPHTVSDYNGSIGLPIPSTTVYIVDDNDQPVPLGEEGQLAIAGPQVMRGYWNNEEATKQALTKTGWFKTGDIGRMDEKGFIYLLERATDMVIVSGFNVYPTEVEQVINSMEQVAECGCVGVKDEKSGEVVKAFVVIAKGATLTEQDILDYCDDKLLRYKIPKHIEFIKELPKTNVGKVLRRALKE